MSTTAPNYTGIFRKYTYLVIMLGLFFGWLLSFPMGQGLYAMCSLHGHNPDMLLKTFLLSHSLGLLLFGLTFNNISFKNELLLLSLLVPVVFTVSFLYLPGHYFNYAPDLTSFVTGLTGLATAPFIINWTCSFVTVTHPAERCRIMALSMTLINILVFVFTALISFLSLKWLVLAGCIPPLLLVFLYLKNPVSYKIPVAHKNPAANNNPAAHKSRKTLLLTDHPGRVTPYIKNIVFLFILVVIFYLTAGYMYGVIYKEHSSMGTLIFSYYALPYIAAALLAGYLGDFSDRKLPAYLGLALLGVSIVIFPVSSGLWGFLLSETVIQAAYAFIDIFLWTTLADIAVLFSASKTYGAGLGLNVFVIFFGISLNNFLTSYNFATLMPLLLLIIIFMGVISLYGFENMYNLEKTKQTDLEVNFLNTLTPREKEVASLMIKGKTNREIAAELKVSENTVKTHIRNILQKAGVPNKIKFVARFKNIHIT